MLAWAIAGPHLMEASSHSEPGLCKISVEAIHHIITSLLHFNSEMAYFHFNESLFKPYESLIQLELCDSDVQDQIIANIQQVLILNLKYFHFNILKYFYLSLWTAPPLRLGPAGSLCSEPSDQ